jgi:hypothetical protein
MGNYLYMVRFLRACGLVAFISAGVLVSGCAGPAPNYAPSIDNVEVIKKAGLQPAKLGSIAVKNDLPGGKSLGIRAASIVSPVGESFGDYIAAALRQELELAKMYSPQSNSEISGMLLLNNIDAGGFSVNAGQIEARFVVKRAGQVQFDKVKRAEMQWESAFAGAVAIPLAANNYPLMVQKLIASLLSDPDFVQALRN